MRVLLDACVPERFARFVIGHNVMTVRAFVGTTDLDDGPVLDRLTTHFDAVVTVDKNLRFQQNLRGRSFRIVLLRTHSNALENLVPLAPALLVAFGGDAAGRLEGLGRVSGRRGATARAFQAPCAPIYRSNRAATPMPFSALTRAFCCRALP